MVIFNLCYFLQINNKNYKGLHLNALRLMPHGHRLMRGQPPRLALSPVKILMLPLDGKDFIVFDSDLSATRIELHLNKAHHQIFPEQDLVYCLHYTMR